MYHLTLLTGHTRESPRSEVADHVIDVLRPWLAPGTHPITQVPGGYSLVVPVVERGYLATVQQGRVPIASIGVAADEGEAEIIWPALVELQRVVAEPVATRPTTTPWCAVALLVVSPAMSDWLGDFERCLAWAYLERGA